MTGLPHVSLTLISDEHALGNELQVMLNEGALGKTATQIMEASREGDPSIWLRGSGNSINVVVPNLMDGEVQIVADRLRELLTE